VDLDHPALEVELLVGAELNQIFTRLDVLGPEVHLHREERGRLGVVVARARRKVVVGGLGAEVFVDGTSLPPVAVLPSTASMIPSPSASSAAVAQRFPT
jgi:hypothetical protein